MGVSQILLDFPETQLTMVPVKKNEVSRPLFNNFASNAKFYSMPFQVSALNVALYGN